MVLRCSFSILDLLSCALNLLLDLLSCALNLLLNLLDNLACGSGGLTQRLIFGLALGFWGRGNISVNLVGTVLLDEIGQVLNGAASRVIDSIALSTSGEQLNGGETLDLDGDIIGLIISVSIESGSTIGMENIQ